MKKTTNASHDNAISQMSIKGGLPTVPVEPMSVFLFPRFNVVCERKVEVAMGNDFGPHRNPLPAWQESA